MLAKYYKLIIFIIILFTFAGCHWFRKKKLKSRISRSAGFYYYIKPGETLWSLSKRYNVDVNTLIELNNVKDPRNIPAGERLFIPAPKKTTKIAYYNSRKLKKYKYRKKFKHKKKIKKSSSKNFQKNLNKLLKRFKGRFLFPVKGGRIVRKFNTGNDRLSEGINIQAPFHSPVVAVDSGMVEYTGDEMEGYGTVIIISHKDDFYSLYSFVSSVKVDLGEKVKAGQTIAYTGKNSFIHFQLRKGVTPVNPEPLFKNK